MPHVRRSMLITIDADVERVDRALVDELGLDARSTTASPGPIRGMPDTTAAPRRDDRRRPTTRATERAARRASATSSCPFFTWFLRIQGWLGARRALPHAAARLGPRVDRRPRLRRRSSRCRSCPPVPFTPEQAARLGALAAVALLANFCGALLSQNGDAVTDAFDRSDEALGVALAVARAGVLVSLVAIALADRLGPPAPDARRAGRRLRGQPRHRACRRRSRSSPARSCSPGPWSTPPSSSPASPRSRRRPKARARSPPACSRSRSAPGFGLAVVLLPLADLGDYGWRISFAVSAAAVALRAASSHGTSRRRGATCDVADQSVAQAGPCPRAVRFRRTGTGSCCSGSPRSSPTCSARRRHSSSNRYLTQRARLHELRRRALPHRDGRAPGHHRRPARQPAGREPGAAPGDHHRPARGDRRSRRRSSSPATTPCSGSRP